VVELGADLGLAFDGDADRLIAVDAGGNVRDGDDLMILFATDFFERNTLGGGLVVTSMANLGLHHALRETGIAIVETDVGDRNVLMSLEEQSWSFGGEQSGHLIFRDLAPTGDGLLTGLMLADLVVRRGPLAEQAERAWQRVPQQLINVARDDYDDEAVHQLFEELRADYGIEASDVRLLIRPSGTEPVVRVMIEALNAEFVDSFAARLQSIFLA
jgi:phosphoglucosamine mutase